VTSKERMLAALTESCRIACGDHASRDALFPGAMPGWQIRAGVLRPVRAGRHHLECAPQARPQLADYPDPLQGRPGFLESRRVSSDAWRVYAEDAGTGAKKLTRYRFVTPGGTLTMVIEDAGYTAWVIEPLIKQKRDIDLLGSYTTAPCCDIDALNQTAAEFGERGLVRGTSAASTSSASRDAGRMPPACSAPKP